MSDSKDHSRSVDTHARDFMEAQERAFFNEKFKVDIDRDIEDIKKLMERVSDHAGKTKLFGEDDRKTLKGHVLFKYSDAQIENRQWTDEDLQLAVEALREKRMKIYFEGMAKRYEQVNPIIDSVVRLDQETEIAQELAVHTPVLIRGNKRVGKTSMLKSLVSHHFGLPNSLFIDVTDMGLGDGVSLEDFQQEFGAQEIAEFIAWREFPGQDPHERIKKVDEIKAEIESGSKKPFEFLNDYLVRRGEKVFVSMDEMMYFKDESKKLRHIAGIKGLSQVHLAIVLHRAPSFENSYREIFDGYKTHFIRALTVEEVGTLVRKPLEGTPVTFTDDAVQKIFEFTGGRAMEINNLCRALLSPSSEHAKYRFTYRAEDIEELAGKTLEQLRKSFEVAIESYRDVYATSMSKEERAIIDRLIQENEMPVSAVEASIIQPLIDTMFVVRDDNIQVYRINGELFKKALAGKNIWLIEV